MEEQDGPPRPALDIGQVRIEDLGVGDAHARRRTAGFGGLGLRLVVSEAAGSGAGVIHEVIVARGVVRVPPITIAMDRIQGESRQPAHELDHEILEWHSNC